MNDKIKNPQRVYDLESRTQKFGAEIIIFAQKVPKNSITLPLISQLIRSGTSIGANYCEADGAESKRDFKHKISLCKKEAKETKHWLKMFTVALPSCETSALALIQEAQELTLIFSAIARK